MSGSTGPYWFPAKRFGWGPPTAWQGWVFLVAWTALLWKGASALGAPETFSSVLFLVSMIGLLLFVCFVKGEPLRR